MEKKSLVLIDDHVIVRSGLKSLIEKQGPYSVVAEFDCAEDFLADLADIPKIDLILLDLSMPGMGGEALVKELKKIQYDCPILILTLNNDENAIIRLFRTGVKGYLLKNCAPTILKKAIESVIDGGYHHNDFLTLSLTNDDSNNDKISKEEQTVQKLTEREREFLKLVCNDQEFTYHQIADQMDVTFRTVDGYRESLFDKFGIKSKTGLVLFVLKNKLIDLL